MAAPAPAVPKVVSAATKPQAASSSLSPANVSLGSVHPDFAAADADIELHSVQGTRYRTYARRLAVGSGFFRALLALPQPPDAPVLCACGDDVRPLCAEDLALDDVLSALPALFEPQEATGSIVPEQPGSADAPTPAPISLPTPFTDTALVPVLHILSGHSSPIIDDLATLDVALALADAWDAPSTLAALRAVLRTLLPTDPVRAYGLARRHGWAAEAASASEASLIYDLSAAPSPQGAASTSAATSFDSRGKPPPSPLHELPTVHLLPLLRLHRARRDRWRAFLDSPLTFVAGNGAPYFCGTCGVTALDNMPWRLLKHALVDGLERCPRGDIVRAMIGDPVEDPVQAVIDVGVSTADAGTATPPPMPIDPSAPPTPAPATPTVPVCSPEAQACWDARCSKEGCGSRNYDRIETIKRLKRCLELLPRSIDDL
ncbi:hypothetical protein HDZ31DRAFT_84922 [Schizophyllum fasciatum]